MKSTNYLKKDQRKEKINNKEISSGYREWRTQKEPESPRKID